MSTNKISLVALLETKVKQNKAAAISSIFAPRFQWLYNYDHHVNGRIWFGWDSSLWNVSCLCSSAQHITCRVSKPDGSCSSIVTMIYAYNEFVARRPLWEDLLSIHSTHVQNFQHPWCLMGDFNTFLHPFETNGDMPRRLRAINDFKDCVDQLGITDLRYTGEVFTWLDCNVDHPISRKLDRVLVNEYWLQKFDLSLACFLPRGLSDHCPSTLHLGIPQERTYKPFQFFHHLLADVDFLPMVHHVWQKNISGNPWFVLTTKLKEVKFAIKDLNARRGSVHNAVSLAKTNLLTFQANMGPAPTREQRLEENNLIAQFQDSLDKEEQLLQQKSRINWIKKGDSNNKFFFSSCKARWNSNKLLSLVDDTGITHTSHTMVSKVAVDYFKSLLGNSTSVDAFPSDIELSRLSEEQMQSMDAQFTNTEIFNTFKFMAKNRSPGPDGLTPEFFVNTWHIIGPQVVAAIQYFFETGSLPRIINSTAISLVPKHANAIHMSHFRPISCCNVLYKCISKLLAERMRRVLPCLISKNQSAFIPGRSIGDNLLLAQSICKDYHLNEGTPRFACKVDLRKAFDTLNWDFLFHTLRRMSFPDKYISWIHKCVTSCMISVKINGSLEGYFAGKSGLRQGDPISPYLFVISMEVLTACIKKATIADSFVYHWRTKDLQLTHLIFADDLLLFSKGDSNSIDLLMKGVECFSKCSGMIPNPDKSLCFFGNVNSTVQEFALNLTGFTRGTLPVKYLGLPLTSNKITARHCEPLINRICSRIEHWTSRHISQAGRVQLINAILFSIQGYWAMFLFLPKCVLKKLQSIMSRFLWRGNFSGPCQFKVAWTECCLPKLEGGLGFHDLHKWNMSAIIFQLWRIITKANSVWVDWVNACMLRRNSFWTMNIPSKCSWSLRKIFKAREFAIRYITYRVGANSDFSLWHDPWVNGRTILQQLDASIISIMESASLARVSSIQRNGNWTFRPTNHVLAMELRSICTSIQPGSVDKILWEGTAGKISVSSIWHTLRPSAPVPPWIRLVWNKFSVPKYSILLWLVIKRRLLTRDRMERFGMNVNPVCMLCNSDRETHEHLFCHCPYTRHIIAACPINIHLDWARLTSGEIVTDQLEETRRNIAALFIATSYHAIWKERNQRIHTNGHAVPAVGIVGAVKQRVKEKLFTCKLFQLKIRSDPSLQLLIV